MSHVDKFIERFPDDMTPEQAACCRYLERRGLRFMIDFGYTNAPDMVWRELDETGSVN